MFPFSFLAARSFRENIASENTVCDRLSSDHANSGHVGSKSQSNVSAAQREKLGRYGFPPMSTTHKTLDHKLATDHSCYGKTYYEKEYVNDRYHRFSKMSQTPVWQTMSTLSLNNLIQQFANTNVGNLEDVQGQEPRGVYTDVQIGEHSLRLQALVWSDDIVSEPTNREADDLGEEDLGEEALGEKELAEEELVEEASGEEVSEEEVSEEDNRKQTVQVDLSSEKDLRLLLVLSPMSGSYLPIGTSLTIAENNLLHSAPNLQWSSNPSCLYTQVFGDWRKRFTVKILLPNALPKTLPALTFEY